MTDRWHLDQLVGDVSSMGQTRLGAYFDIPAPKWHGGDTITEDEEEEAYVGKKSALTARKVQERQK